MQREREREREREFDTWMVYCCRRQSIGIARGRVCVQVRYMLWGPFSSSLLSVVKDVSEKINFTAFLRRECNLFLREREREIERERTQNFSTQGLSF